MATAALGGPAEWRPGSRLAHMEFEYEIKPDDYAAAAVLHAKLIRNPRKLSPWLSGGVILLLVAILERDRGLSPILLGAIGVWWMSADIARIFPGLFLRRYYRRYAVRLGLENNKYRASINQRGFQVDGGSQLARALAGRFTKGRGCRHLHVLCARNPVHIREALSCRRAAANPAGIRRSPTSSLGRPSRGQKSGMPHIPLNLPDVGTTERSNFPMSRNGGETSGNPCHWQPRENCLKLWGGSGPTMAGAAIQLAADEGSARRLTPDIVGR